MEVGKLNVLNTIVVVLFCVEYFIFTQNLATKLSTQLI